MTSVLNIANIGKAYRNYGSEWRRVFSWFGLPLRPLSEHWTLKNISFTIRPGEAVGIVGQNGAGKSTLLKIITGTLRPSEGEINTRGRIAAILELGMGFHPDLSGRQNVYHSAGLMGYLREQIDAAINDIETFAEIGEYFDQPVRTYSSGMQMRVAFAVATAYRPDILIIDEALSVGDTYFQHKSFDRIREFQKQGATLLIVSHDRSAIQAICNRAILLEKGSIIKDGAPEEIMDFYNALIAEKENNSIEQVLLDNGKVQTTSGTGEASIEAVGLYNEKGEKIEFVGVGAPIELRISIKANANLPELVLGYMIKDRLGQPVFGTNTFHMNAKLEHVKQGEHFTYRFYFPANLGVGSYSITLALHAADSHIVANYEWCDMALIFNVLNTQQDNFVGTVWLPPKLECIRD